MNRTLALELFLILFGIQFAQVFYPYPFVYGVYKNDTTLSNGIVTNRGMDIAWNVTDIIWSGNRAVGLKVKTLCGINTISFNLGNDFPQVSSEYTYMAPTGAYTPIKVNATDKNGAKALALSVEWSINQAVGYGTCQATGSYGSWQLNQLKGGNQYSSLINNAFKLYEPIYNGAWWNYNGGTQWTISDIHNC